MDRTSGQNIPPASPPFDSKLPGEMCFCWPKPPGSVWTEPRTFPRELVARPSKSKGGNRSPASSARRHSATINDRSWPVTRYSSPGFGTIIVIIASLSSHSWLSLRPRRWRVVLLTAADQCCLYRNIDIVSKLCAWLGQASGLPSLNETSSVRG